MAGSLWSTAGSTRRRFPGSRCRSPATATRPRSPTAPALLGCATVSRRSASSLTMRYEPANEPNYPASGASIRETSAKSGVEVPPLPEAVLLLAWRHAVRLESTFIVRGGSAAGDDDKPAHRRTDQVAESRVLAIPRRASRLLEQ